MKERHDTVFYDNVHASAYEWQGTDEDGRFVPKGVPLNQFIEKRLRERGLIRRLSPQEKRTRKQWLQNSRESADKAKAFKEKHPLKKGR